MIPFEKIVTLHHIPLFAHLSTENLHHIANIAQEQAFSAGTLLFQQGEEGGSLFIIVSGQIELSRQQAQQPIGQLGKEEFLGDLSLFNGETRSTSAKCCEASLLLVIEKEDMDALINEHPSIALGLLQAMSQRMHKLLCQQKQ